MRNIVEETRKFVYTRNSHHFPDTSLTKEAMQHIRTSTCIGFGVEPKMF